MPCPSRTVAVDKMWSGRSMWSLFLCRLGRTKRPWPSYLALLCCFLLLQYTDVYNRTHRIGTAGGGTLDLARYKMTELQNADKLRFIPNPTVTEVQCSKLFQGDLAETALALQYGRSHRRSQRTLSADQLMELTSDCDIFRRTRSYTTVSMTEEEEQFPIAFSIVFYKDPGQAERLLRAIYRPQNYYCIQVDRKSSPEVHRAMAAVASCFPNVFLSSRGIRIDWGTLSVVEAELNCMEDLWKYKDWKYFINLTGQEFPLKTNLELVRILNLYRGANDIPGISIEKMPLKFRSRVKFTRVNPMNWTEPQKPHHAFRLPLNISKGSAHMTASRGFVDFLLHADVAKEFLQWVNGTYIADETYYTTLNHNPSLNVPGGYLGGSTMSAFSNNRYKMWRGYGLCSTEFIRGICILGVGDLPRLLVSHELFANKFRKDSQPLAYDCMEELHYARMRRDVIDHAPLETSYYETLPFVRAGNANRNYRPFRTAVPLGTTRRYILRNETG